jgi:hypothetical protein
MTSSPETTLGLPDVLRILANQIGGDEQDRLLEAAAEIEKLRAAIHGMLTWVEQRPRPHPYDTWKAARVAVGLPE